MNAVDSAAEALLPWLAKTGWQVALLVVLVLAAQRVLRPWLSPRARHALWLLVLARLVMPSLPAAPWSVFNLTPAVTVSAEPALPEARPDAAPVVASVPPRRRARKAIPAVPEATPAAPVPKRSRPGRRRAPVQPAVTFTRLLFLVWAIGALVLLGRIFVLEWRFARRLRGARRAGGRAVALLEDTARELGIRKPPALLETAAVDAPALYGAVRPRLLLPPGVASAFSDAELRCVLRHELAHLASFDALLDRLAAVLECVHWFNPAVWFALRRMREDREAARDSVALRGADEQARLTYGHTIIRLIETCAVRYRPALVRMSCSKEQLKRRISMIADPIRSTRRTKIVALGAAATIGLATLTGASQGSTAVPRRGQDFKSVRVTDFVAAPAWERTLRRKLQQEVVLDLGATSLPNAISWLRRKTEIDFVVHPDIADSTDENFECELPGMPVAKALDVLCDGFGVEYGLRNGAVYVGERGGARALVKRVYDVRELIQSVNGEEDEEPDYWPERLAHLIHAVVGNEGDWDREGVRRDFWRGALIVTQTHEVHRELLAFLNRLLNHGRGPRSGVDAASAELAKQLAARVSVDYQEADIGEIASFLKKHGLPVLMHEDVDPDTTVELHLRDAALRDVIAHVASLAGIRITLHRGFVRIGYEDQPLHVRYYDISKLLTTQGEADEDLEDGLIELVRGSVPGIWDEEGTKIEFWKDLMLVRQSDAGHREVRAFLDALMRALER